MASSVFLSYFYSSIFILVLPNTMKFTCNTGSDHDGDNTPAVIDRRKPRIFTVKLAPQSVINWYDISIDKKIARRNAAIKEEALGHLLAMGWKIYPYQKKTRQELRYESPKGRVYISLRKACKAYIDQAAAVSTSPPVGEGKEVSPLLRKRKECVKSPLRNCEKKKPAAGGTASKAYIDPAAAVRMKATVSEGKESVLSLTKTEQCVKSPMRNWGNKKPAAKETAFKAAIDQPAAAVSTTDFVGKGKEPILRSKKSEQCAESPIQNWGKKKRSARGNLNPRTALFRLIEQGIVSPGEKAYYKMKTSAKDDPLMAWGTITKGGLIKCDCCYIPFSISKFEVHIGSTKHRPSTNIFLKDGRSLLDCQKQLIITQNHNDDQKVQKSLKSDTIIFDKSDNFCSICNFGGELILCDLCPAAFHSTCLGFNSIPLEDWFCPSCICKICGQFPYDSDVVCSNHHESLHSSFVKCVQCQLSVHIGCVMNNSNQSNDKQNWYCSNSCKDVHMNLQNLLWKQIPTQKDKNLTWTLMKYTNSLAEHHRKKLNIALDLIHENFQPVKDPITENDIIQGVIFSTRSEVKRLNFEGFYTMVLEMKNIVTTVATVRVYGDEVAEVPFVATRLEYRRLGLCRTLMNELEQQLLKLGVKRLTLPAVDEALDTWSSGFGFSKMTDSDQLELVKYTFLGFEHTVRCHKNLEKKRINNQNDLECGPRKKLKQTELEDDFFSYTCLDSWNSISDAFD